MNTEETGLQVVPDDVLAAVRKIVRGWLLGHYTDERRRLERWDDHYAGLIEIHSYNLPGSTQANLYRLKRLADAGTITLKRRVSGIYCFTLPRQILDVLAQEETQRYESMGYVVGQLVPEIKHAEGVSA